MSKTFETLARKIGPSPGELTSGDVHSRAAAMICRGWGGASMFGTGSLLSAEVALVGGVTAPVVAALAGIYGIGRVSERANQLGNYNAFLTGFAGAVSDFSRGVDRRRVNPVFADASVQGRNAAIRVLNRVGAEGRAELFAELSRMQDSRAVATVVERMGGYRTS